MNKNELCLKIAEEAGISQACAGRVLTILTREIMNAVASGDSVQLTGFGTFKQTSRGERVGRNPQTGESIQIPATNVPRFSPSGAFKAAVNK